MIEKNFKALSTAPRTPVVEEPYEPPETVKTSLRLARAFKAGEAIGSPRVIMLNAGQAFLFDPLVEANSTKLIGVSENSAGMGGDVIVVQKGVVTLRNSFRAGMIYYAAARGVLSCALPVCGISVKIGIGLDADTMLVQMSEPLLLA